MPDSGNALTVESVERLAEIHAAAWDACAGADNPFLSFAFLDALEESGCVGPRTGWAARHLIARDAAGAVVGAVPLYVKSHSQGEYVFDHSWAQAYANAGGRYYPKLQACVPFTPVPGPRLLARPGPSRDAVREALAQALAGLPRRTGASSLHVTFCDDGDAELLAESGFALRRGVQFHWANRGYASFDDFLATLSHSRRKAIKRERRDVAETGIEFVGLTGGDLTRAHWDAFYGFYVSTSDRKWGNPYLNRRFFELLHDRLAERVLLVMGRKDGEWVCGALNLIGADTLYGRNWGASIDLPFLHFEACYYRALDFAIARKLSRVEAGAQGEHKLQRGYMPVPTWSAHALRDPGFEKAVREFCRAEDEAMRSHIRELAAEGPYKVLAP
jgi:predicted N-acyltransferase